MQEEIKVSLIASSVRPKLYESFFKSLEGTSVEYEVVFAGNLEKDKIRSISGWIGASLSRGNQPNYQYIITKNIKPAQCYEIARRHAEGELIHWTADDAEYKGDILGHAYRYWKKQNNEKLILSLQTREFYLGGGDGFCDMHNHSFIGGDPKTPLMAPLGMISRKYFEKLGGFDRRFLCGQQENLCVMMVYADGGMVEVFGNKTAYIEIDHVRKSIESGESKRKDDFFNRPFARGYKHDRQILESICKYKDGVITVESFEPFEEKDLLTKSQSYKGQWE